jgi:hypothetical protein
MAYREFSYIGIGQVYLSTSGGPLLSVGNASSMSFSFDEEKKNQKDYTSPGGGNANSVSRIDNFTGSLTMHDYTAANLALALRGAVTEIAAAAVSDEAHASHGIGGELIPFDFHYDPLIAPVVTLTNATACTADTDYELTPNGILTIEGGNIDDQGIMVGYTKAVSEQMEALVESGQEFRLEFDGQNEAQDGKATRVELHRVKFSPAQGLQFLGGEYGEIPIEFEVLSDSSIVGAQLSKYFKLSQVV